MLVIRFLRTGKKGQAFFKIVVTEKQKAPTKGRFVEEVGFYNPLTKEKSVKADRVKYWLSVGAQTSPTVHNLLISEKVIEGKKIPVHAKTKKLKEEKPTEAQPAPVEAPKVEEKPVPEAKTESVEDEIQQTEQKEKTEEKPKEEKKEPVEAGDQQAEGKKTEVLKETPKTE
ncbi:MAG: 30S ribosomal protein S16 [bacterium]|nr:30S ribosomal protein S16 [bacterium]